MIRAASLCASGLSALLMVLVPWVPVRADQPYWVCKDTQNRPVVQDAPCADAPDAPPAGMTDVPPPVHKAAPAPLRRQTGGDVDPYAYWKGLYQYINPAGRADALIHNPLSWIAGGALLLLLALRGLATKLRRRRRQTRVEATARSTPDGFRAAMNAAVPQGPVAQPPRADRGVAVAPVPRMPTTRPRLWSAELLAALPIALFGTLCVQLWRMRGVRAEVVPLPSRLHDCELRLYHPSAPERLHGIVLCRAHGRVPMGGDLVRDLTRRLAEERCDYGVLMGPGEFTPEARDLVRGRMLELKGTPTLLTEINALPDEERAALLRLVTPNADPAS